MGHVVIRRKEGYNFSRVSLYSADIINGVLSGVQTEVCRMAESKKVVCIEDEQEMIDLVKLILGQHGFEVVGAVGGQEGFGQGLLS